jgi:hypothetical protein
MFDGDHRLPGGFETEAPAPDEDAMWEDAAPSSYGRRRAGGS